MNMNADFDKKKALLQARNAQLVYIRSLREGGLKDPENLFRFMDEAQTDNVMQAIMLHRAKRSEEDIPTKDAALKLLTQWLANHEGTVFLFIPNVGVMQGQAADFLRNFDYFTPLIEVNLLFATPGTDEFVECSRFEGSYVCRTNSP